MGHIRTVKPSLFRHEQLFELERATRLPIRTAWIGLFTVADREGRFEWKPNVLKLDILPWDEVDFNQLLESLRHAGFISRYESQGKVYGYIPTWHQHQRPNQNEGQSRIPAPPLDAPSGVINVPQLNPYIEHAQTQLHMNCTTADVQDTDSCVTSNPQEVEMEVEYDLYAQTDLRNCAHTAVCEQAQPEVHNKSAQVTMPKQRSGRKRISYPPEFEEVYMLYPRRIGKDRGYKIYAKQIVCDEDRADLIKAIEKYKQLNAQTDKQYFKHFDTFMRNWEEYLLEETGTFANGRTTQLTETNVEDL